MFEHEEDDDVIEKQLQNFVELIDEIGASFIGSRLKAISGVINLNLEPPEGEEEDELDHDEMVIANTTDLIISIARAMGPDYENECAETLSKLFARLAPNFPYRDWVLCVGALAEIFM